MHSVNKCNNKCNNKLYFVFYTEWNPEFNLSWDDFKFSTKIQPIHLLETRAGGGSLSSFGLNDLRNRFLQNLQIFLGDNSIDNVVLCKQKVYLYDLYFKVTIYGGYYSCINKKSWKNIATELGVIDRSQSSYLIKLCYEIYLLDYEHTHNFATYKNLEGSPKERYINYLKNYPEKVKKITKFNQISNQYQFQLTQQQPTCSVCGLPPNYNMNNIILECCRCGNRWHTLCHQPHVTYSQLAMLQAGQMTNWTCTNCTIQQKEKFGYHTSGNIYSLKEYQQRSQQLIITTSFIRNFWKFFHSF